MDNGPSSDMIACRFVVSLAVLVNCCSEILRQNPWVETLNSMTSRARGILCGLLAVMPRSDMSNLHLSKAAFMVLLNGRESVKYNPLRGK